MSICLVYLINLPGAILNCANTHPNTLSFTVIRTHPPSLVCSSLPSIPTSLQPTTTHVLTSPTHFKPICSLSHQFLVYIQIRSTNPTHYLPFQPTLSPCVLCAYVLYIPVCFCAFGFHVPMCLCNSFLRTLLPMPIHFTRLCLC